MKTQRKGAKTQTAQRVMKITSKNDKKISNTVDLCAFALDFIQLNIFSA